MAAQTYLDHGLLTESREIFSQIFRNLSHLKKTKGNFSTELSEWFEAVEIDLREKLNLLNQQIDFGHNSKAPAGRAVEAEEEDNSKTLYLKGIGLKELGFLDDAMTCFRKALEKGHPAYECLKEVMEVLKQKEEWHKLAGEIKGCFGQYEMSNEERTELWRKLGALYEKSNLNEQAFDAFKKADECGLLVRNAEAKKLQAEPFNQDESPFDEHAVEETVGTLSNSDETGKEMTTGIEPDFIKGHDLDPEHVLAPQPSSESPEIRALKEKIAGLKTEIVRLRELSSEYQKRYQSIMSYSNAIQKENKVLKEKLERQGDLVSASDKK
jgi:tetratricopeptide (TPR) repeat protein